MLVIRTMFAISSNGPCCIIRVTDAPQDPSCHAQYHIKFELKASLMASNNNTKALGEVAYSASLPGQRVRFNHDGVEIFDRPNISRLRLVGFPENLFPVE